MTYYTEYPTDQFEADSDSRALLMTAAEVVYRESDNDCGVPFVMLRDVYMTDLESGRKFTDGLDGTSDDLPFRSNARGGATVELDTPAVSGVGFRLAPSVRPSVVV